MLYKKNYIFLIKRPLIYLLSYLTNHKKTQIYVVKVKKKLTQ